MSDTSNSSTLRAPLLPASRRDQLASTPQANGVTRPSPVMTTRRIFCSFDLPVIAHRSAHHCPTAPGLSWLRGLLSAGLLLEELDRVAYRLDLLGSIVRDLAAELLLERHD